jgi:hypothetical protein
VPLNDPPTSASFPIRLRGTVSCQHLDDVARPQQFEARPGGRALFDDERRRQHGDRGAVAPGSPTRRLIVGRLFRPLDRNFHRLYLIVLTGSPHAGRRIPASRRDFVPSQTETCRRAIATWPAPGHEIARGIVAGQRNPYVAPAVGEIQRP